MSTPIRRGQGVVIVHCPRCGEEIEAEVMVESVTISRGYLFVKANEIMGRHQCGSES